MSSILSRHWENQWQFFTPKAFASCPQLILSITLDWGHILDSGIIQSVCFVVLKFLWTSGPSGAFWLNFFEIESRPRCSRVPWNKAYSSSSEKLKGGWLFTHSHFAATPVSKVKEAARMWWYWKLLVFGVYQWWGKKLYFFWKLNLRFSAMDLLQKGNRQQQ